MPVTKTARRALRGSAQKESVNKLIISKLEVAVRQAKKSKTAAKVIAAISLTDRAAKKRVIHKNRASRVKAQLTKLLPRSDKSATKTKASKKK